MSRGLRDLLAAGHQRQAVELLRALRESGLSLQGVDLTEAVLDGVWLEEAQLSDARLRAASLCGARLNGASLCRVVLDSADLSDAELEGADLSGASLDGAMLSGARYSMSTRWPEGFDPQDEGAVLAHGWGAVPEDD
jgi:uncharacterized protein YjbI with pentapeptide repeats